MRGRFVCLNGQLLPEKGLHLSALDRGFTLGDGVFDTMGAVAGRVFRLGDHLARLGRSAATLALPVPMSPAELGESIRRLLAANGLEDAIVRVTVSRGVPAERGILPPTSPSPTVAIQAVPFGGYPEERYHAGFTAATVRIRRNETSPISFIKSCCYLDMVLARMGAAERGADEALLLNTGGWAACGSSSNLFIVSDGVLCTPSLECGVLDGVTRRTVLEAAAELGLQAAERKLAPGEVARAEEAFLTNTALGVMPLVALDGRPLGRGEPGAVTRRLREAYREIVRCSSGG